MNISLEIERVYERALLLRKRATELPVQPDLVEAALKELLFVLEELHTAQEELHYQNQELIATRQAVELERQRYQALFELAPDAYLVTDRQGKIYQANRAAAHLFSIPQEYLIKKPLVVLIHEPDRPLFHTRLANLKQVQEWEVSLNPRNGNMRTVAIAVTQLKGHRGEEDALLWSLRDITVKKQMEQSLHSLAYYDSLTALPNRCLLLDRIKNALSVAKRGGHYGALLFIDLDRFKTLNDTRGHQVGDHLLCQVAMRLKDSLREADTVARFGGDEFVVLLLELSDEQELAARLSLRVGEKICTNLSTAFLIEGEEIIIGASIGITLFPKGTETVNNLLTEADTAMYQAKVSGGNTVRLFETFF